MKKVVVQSGVLLLLAVLVYFYSRFQRNDSPSYVISEIVAQCTFDPPGKYRVGPYSKSINWCNNGDMKSTDQLITHLKLYSDGMDIGFGAEFGSNVRIAYIVAKKLIIINPIIVDREAEMIWCEDNVGGVVVKKLRANAVLVEFMDEDLFKQRIWFKLGAACRIQTLIEYM